MYVSQGKSLIKGQKEEDNCDAEGQGVWKSNGVNSVCVWRGGASSFPFLISFNRLILKLSLLSLIGGTQKR